MNRDTAEELYQFVKKTPHTGVCAVFNSPGPEGPCTCGKQRAEDILYRFATQK